VQVVRILPRTRGAKMARATVVALMLLLQGCSLLDSVPEKVLVDTLCLTANKRQWTANDPPETIRDAQAWNKQVDRQCGVPRKVASRQGLIGVRPCLMRGGAAQTGQLASVPGRLRTTASVSQTGWDFVASRWAPVARRRDDRRPEGAP
jgi:hypothetical protein